MSLDWICIIQRGTHMSHKGEMITITGKDEFDFTAYQVATQGNRKGGLVLIQEIFGVTDHIKDLCDGYAARGFDVIAPSLYDRSEKGFQATYSQEDIQRSIGFASAFPIENVLDDVQLCIDLLKDKGPVNITGYCYGGSVVWLAACRCEGLAAASSYYGRFAVNYLEETPKCPVILHFGEHDKSIPMDEVNKMIAAYPDVPIHIYDADHGFNSDRRVNYDETAASLALDRTLSLFADKG
jgi:carboxymethylenebutenolidase